MHSKKNKCIYAGGVRMQFVIHAFFLLLVAMKKAFTP